MATTPQYSTLFACLHDEPQEYGNIGRGTHYSVLRSVEWQDVTRHPLRLPEVHDFAVIWDEDHDLRIIEAIERIYMAGLLSPVQFIGERKGFLTVIVAAKFYWSGTEADAQAYEREILSIAKSLSDPWEGEVGTFDKAGARNFKDLGWHQTDPRGIIADDTNRVNLYLANIDSLWNLGTKPPTWPTTGADADWQRGLRVGTARI